MFQRLNIQCILIGSWKNTTKINGKTPVNSAATVYNILLSAIQSVTNDKILINVM